MEIEHFTAEKTLEIQGFLEGKGFKLAWAIKSDQLYLHSSYDGA